MLWILLIGLGAPLLTASAGEADVIRVTVVNQGDRLYRFDVTVAHSDTGWKHYADRWEILDTAGNILATRVLVHPHVDEQPFTRSLDNVTLPVTIRTVVIRAHDLVHGYGGKTKTVRISP